MGEKKKLLLIEDDELIREGLAERFALDGMEVATATNGKEGLESALKHKPELIFLDLLMPVMDGLAFLSELRKTNWGKTIHVIVLTNSRDLELEQKAKNLNVHGYYIKSDHSFKELSKIACDVLNK